MKQYFISSLPWKMFCMSEKLLTQNFHNKRFLHTTEIQAQCDIQCFNSERGKHLDPYLIDVQQRCALRLFPLQTDLYSFLFTILTKSKRVSWLTAACFCDKHNLSMISVWVNTWTAWGQRIISDTSMISLILHFNSQREGVPVTAFIRVVFVCVVVFVGSCYFLHARLLKQLRDKDRSRRPRLLLRPKCPQGTSMWDTAEDSERTAERKTKRRSESMKPTPPGLGHRKLVSINKYIYGQEENANKTWILHIF